MQRFNLVDEPFIVALGMDNRMHEISLLEALIHAHRYVDIGGEMATQDAAITRLLLAIVHTVFSRTNEDGIESPLEDEDEAIDRWSEIWEMGQFPEVPIRNYLETWHDRFWLFHPERPFYQVPDVYGLTAENALEKTGLSNPDCTGPKTKATFTSAKLNGEIGESGNKVRLFSPRLRAAKRTLTFAEAARWLITFHGFDDASGKESKESKGARTEKADDSIGVGWLGKLSLAQAVGRNLFETLMLNCVFIRDGRELFGEDRPTWEREVLEVRERNYIPVPDNFAEILTIQSRRVLLIADEKSVLGFASYGGDFFNREGAVNEQFTMWTVPKASKGKSSLPVPRYQDLPVQMWREISSLLIREEPGSGSGHYPPGVVSWIRRLPENLSPSIIAFRYVKIKYDSKNCSATNCISDSLSMSRDLLTKLGENRLIRIAQEVKKCDDAAYAVKRFGENLFDAEGGDMNGRQFKSNREARIDAGNIAAERYYFEMDLPFRRWLMSLSARDSREKFEHDIQVLRKIACDNALRLGRQMYESSSPSAFAGHWSGKESSERKHCSSPEAYLIFQRIVGRALNTEKKDECASSVHDRQRE